MAGCGVQGTLGLQVNFTAASGSTGIPGSPFDVRVMPAPAPRLLSAQLGSDLASILLSFDIATDQVCCCCCWSWLMQHVTYV